MVIRAVLLWLALCGLTCAQPIPVVNPAEVFLGRLTASSSASLSFPFGVGFYVIRLYCSGIRPATEGAVPKILYGTGSPPSYQTSGYQWSAIYNTPATSTPTGAASTSDTSINPNGIGFSNSANNLMLVAAELPASSSTGFHLTTFQITGYHTTEDTFENIQGMGTWTGGTSAITGLEFLFSTGNIAAGSCSLYGYNQ